MNGGEAEKIKELREKYRYLLELMLRTEKELEEKVREFEDLSLKIANEKRFLKELESHPIRQKLEEDIAGLKRQKNELIETIEILQKGGGDEVFNKVLALKKEEKLTASEILKYQKELEEIKKGNLPLLAKEKDKIVKEIKDLEEKQTILREINNELEKVNSEIKKKSQKEEERVSKLYQEVQTCANDIASLSFERKQVKKELKYLNSTELKDELESLTKTLAEKKGELNGIQKDIDQNLGKFSQDIQYLNREKNRILEENKGFIKDLGKRDKALQEQEIIVQNEINEIENKKVEIESRQAGLSKRENEISKKEDEIKENKKLSDGYLAITKMREKNASRLEEEKKKDLRSITEELGKQTRISESILKRQKELDLEEEALNKTKIELEKERERLNNETKHLFSQQAQLRSALPNPQLRFI